MLASRLADMSAAVALRKESVDRNNGVHYDNYNLHCVALRKESVDRNLCRLVAGSLITLSLSARRAWIEIATLSRFGTLKQVALRKESVDRNVRCTLIVDCTAVALRKESVDRNAYGVMPVSLQVVALRKESVDRNYCRCYPCNTCYRVALRKESVDRNLLKGPLLR